MCLGLCLAMYALLMDTTVPFFNERINNLGLLNDQQNYLTFSLIIVLISIFIIFISSRKDRNKSNTSLVDPLINRARQYENIEKISNLLEKGILTKEEFENEKKKILSNNIDSEDVTSNLEFENKGITNNLNSTKVLVPKYINTSYKLGKLFGAIFIPQKSKGRNPR